MSLRALGWALLGCLAALAVAGCQAASHLAGEVDPRGRPAEQAYREVLDRYLVEKKDHTETVLNLMVTALPLNWPVRQAQVGRLAAAFLLEPAQKEEKLAGQREDFAKYDAVVVSFYTAEKSWNRLAGFQSPWRVFLSGPVGRVAPADIRRISEKNPQNEALYPFWGQWSDLYILRFPKTGDPAPTTLVVTGPAGRVELPLELR
ncbi:MAG: hypothetical protein KQJ78_03580 [Deltaproteobacteria bacterium]|nr:hypothetical protein [Deltaproteobacteria bacterium]